MKAHILFSLLLPILCHATPGPTLTLTGTNHISITGEISSYYPASGNLKIRTKNSTCKHQYNEFTPASQKKIDHWLADKNFLTKSKLTADFDLGHQNLSSNITGSIIKRGTHEVEEGLLGTEEKQFSFYTIHLTNRSPSLFKKVSVEYRIFYTQPIASDLLGKYQLAGTIRPRTVEPNTTWTWKTSSFESYVYYRSAPDINWRSQPDYRRATLEGIWILLRKKNVLGDWIERELEFGDIPKKRERDEYQKVYGKRNPTAPPQRSKNRRKKLSPAVSP